MCACWGTLMVMNAYYGQAVVTLGDAVLAGVFWTWYRRSRAAAQKLRKP